MYQKTRQYQLGDLLTGGGGFSGSSSASSSASSYVAPNVSSGGLNIWEIVLALGALLIIGLLVTLHKK